MVLVDKKITQAAILYYSRFGTEDGLTVRAAARKFEINAAELHSYMAEHPDIGMPDDREDAMKYLSVLEQELNS